MSAKTSTPTPTVRPAPRPIPETKPGPPPILRSDDTRSQSDLDLIEYLVESFEEDYRKDPELYHKAWEIAEFSHGKVPLFAGETDMITETE